MSNQSDLEQSVIQKQASALFAHAKMGMISTTLVCFILSIVVLPEIDNKNIIVLWIVLKILILIPRVLLANQYQRINIKKAFIVNRILLLLDGIVLALLPGWILNQLSIELMAIVLLVYSGITSVAAIGLYADSKSTCNYTAPILLTLIIVLATRRDEFGYISSALTILYSFLLLKTSKRIELKFLELISLRYETHRLNDERANLIAVKERFLSNMTHELRTPLAGIVGLLAINDISERHLKLVRESADRILNIITNILEFTNIGALEKNNKLDELDLSQTINNLAIVFLPAIECKGLRLITDVQSGCFIKSDKLRLEQLLHNIIENAVTHTESPGYISIVMSHSKNHDSSRDVRLTITNNGINTKIPSAVIDHIYDPFFLVNDSSNKKSGGIGLGLSICKEIVKLLDLEIACKSDEKIGTSFEIFGKFTSN